MLASRMAFFKTELNTLRLCFKVGHALLVAGGYTPITLYPSASLYTIIIIFDTVNEFVNSKDNEFNSAAIALLWHPPAMLCGVQINVNIALSENIVLLLYRHVDVLCSLVVT